MTYTRYILYSYTFNGGPLVTEIMSSVLWQQVVDYAKSNPELSLISTDKIQEYRVSQIDHYEIGTVEIPVHNRRKSLYEPFHMHVDTE